MIDRTTLSNIRVFLERVPTANMSEARQLFQCAVEIEKEISRLENPAGTQVIDVASDAQSAQAEPDDETT